MTTAILLAGPSLARLESAPDAELVIGVKRAAIRFPSDWCVVLDSPDLRAPWFADVTAPLLLTRREYRPKYTDRGGTDCEALQALLPHKPTKWGCFSSSAALVLAKFLGAESIDVYGADFGMGDTLAEFDGFVSPEQRYTPDRWEFERHVWDATIDALSLKVVRHGIDGRSR